MVCAIVLAAGQSRRMGTQKLLLPWGKQTVIQRIVEEVDKSPVDQIFVVVGKDGDRIRASLKGCSVRYVTNANPESEMLESVRCGWGALPQSCQGVLVVLGDQPGIKSKVIQELVQAFNETKCGIFVPTYQGKRGHPVLIASSYRDEILNQYDQTGLRGLLQAHADEVTEIDVSSPDILDDLDTPSDYDQAKKRIS